VTPEEAAEKQKAYVRKRRAWCRKIGFPIAGHENPDPGELELADPENG
jgi:hypothetical protein